jgi:GTPase SAR1 family protein
MRARDNPFSSERIDRVCFRPQGQSWRQIMVSLARLGFRASIVGPHGSGKTIMLESLVPRLKERGYSIKLLRLSSARPKIPKGWLKSISRNRDLRNILIVDGADQMGPVSWLFLKHISRRAGGLIVATHCKGMLPVLLECTTSPHLLNEIVTDLVGEEAAPLRDTNAMLFAKHKGNLRSALRELYDIYAEREYHLLLVGFQTSDNLAKGTGTPVVSHRCNPNAKWVRPGQAEQGRPAGHPCIQEYHQKKSSKESY